MKKEYDLKKMKVKRRGKLAGLENESADSAKVKITISLDQEVIDYFKSEAKKPGELPYQTQINQALRKLIEKHKQSKDDDLELLKKTLMQDASFIKKLAEELKRRQHK